MRSLHHAWRYYRTDEARHGAGQHAAPPRSRESRGTTWPRRHRAMKTIERAELISVGTELLLGEIVDTNSAWLAADLARRGVDVLWSARVGDNQKRIEHLVAQALTRSDLVVLGGGLGPTDDDLTRDAVAAVVGEEQRLDEGLVAWLREYFATTGRPMPERNL